MGLVVSWVFTYDADRAFTSPPTGCSTAIALTQTFLDGGEASARPSTRPATSAAAGLTLSSRPAQKLALVFLPVLLLVVQQEITLQIPDSVQNEWAWTWRGRSGRRARPF